jgi:hypothetical protein
MQNESILMQEKVDYSLLDLFGFEGVDFLATQTFAVSFSKKLDSMNE